MCSKFRGSALALLLVTVAASRSVSAAPPVTATPPAPNADSTSTAPKSEATSASASSEAELEQTDPETLARARELFWKAHALFEKGEYVEALRLFEQTYALRQEPEVLFNLAVTHLRLNHCDQARSSYQEYRTKVESATDAANPLKELAELDEHCGVEVAPLPPPEATARVPAPLSMVVVKPPPPTTPAHSLAPEPAPSADVADESSTLRALGWVAVGASAVALGAAVYFEVQRREYGSEYDEADQGDDAAVAYSGYYRSRNLAIAMGAASAVLAAGGITLLVVAPSTPAQSSASPMPALGLRFSGSF